MPHHRKTCHRYDVPGDVHFLTFSCFKRLPLLHRDRTRTWLVDAIRAGQQKDHYYLFAWVVMPEHVHLVLLPRGTTSIATILSAIKQSSSKRALYWLQQNAPDFLPQLCDRQPNGSKSHRFWQRGGGYDRNLRSVRDIHEKIRYVHQNPVRRGLVSAPADWHWSSAHAWECGSDLPLKIDRDRLPSLTIADEPAFKTLMRDGD